jgi:hypothetical protein
MRIAIWQGEVCINVVRVRHVDGCTCDSDPSACLAAADALLRPTFPDAVFEALDARAPIEPGSYLEPAREEARQREIARESERASALQTLADLPPEALARLLALARGEPPRER